MPSHNFRATPLKVVESTQREYALSLRGPKGRGDAHHPHISTAGFEPGDDVVLIHRDDLIGLFEAAGVECPKELA